MFTRENIDGVRNAGGNVLTTDGDRIGSIGQVYTDDDNGNPTWVTVKTGLFGMSESFVPLQGANVEGTDILVPYTKDQVKDAPRVDTDGHLEPSEEERLYAHYGLTGGDTTYTDANRRTDTYDTDQTVGTGRDTTTAGGDDAMTRSEERLNVGTEKQEAGRARLRKYVTTENVTQTVPVRREEVRLEREPITEENRGAAMSGPDIAEDEHEITLHEERPVVEKETVPVERVRLGKETVTDEAAVEEEVRKENIDTDTDRGETRR
jgi:uncharacterized protein (TIGR02271 family)